MSHKSNRKSPLIIAHRGGMKEGPENVVATFERAFRCGVDGIELDVQMSRDGALFVYHDPSLRRGIGLDRALSELDSADIERMTLTWGDAHIPRLEDVLRFTDDGVVMVEIKSFPADRASGRAQDLTQRTVALLQESVAPQRAPFLYVLSFDNNVLLTAHAVDPSLNYVLNTENAHAIMTQAPADDGHIQAYCAPVITITSEFVTWAHKRGKRVATWSANDEAVYDMVVRAGVDIVMTDRPRWLMSLLVGRGAR